MKGMQRINKTIWVIFVLAITSVSYAGSPVWTFTPLTATTISVSSGSTATIQYQVTNQSRRSHTLQMKAISGISQDTSSGNCTNPFTLGYQQSCTLTLTVDGSLLQGNVVGGPVVCQQGNALQCYQPSAGDALDITRTTAPGATTLSTSIPPLSILALSVNDTALNAALTGNARYITIQNTGTNPASGLSVSAIGLPTGTNITTIPTTCTGTLAPNATCTVTITPGSNATSSCTTGIAPTPGTITVSATNVATPVTSNVVVLSYGCQYQGGFLYSVNDTTNNGVTGACTTPPCTGSIGGKVSSLVDQAAPYINSGSQASIIWSSNGNGATSSNVNYRTILGIDETSTTAAPSPTSPTYPSGTPAYTACNGASDGACDSGNILSYYNFNRASGGSAPTPLSYYAAGLCTATINSYSGWYLPSICEMDAVNTNLTCPTAAQSMLGSLSFLLGDPGATTPSTSCTPPSGTDCLAGHYWSSTETSYNPQFLALAEYFSTGSTGQVNSGKNNRFGVRCSRALTL